MKTFDRLAEKIKKDTGIELERFRRTYASAHMLECGFFSWCAWVKDSRLGAGSVSSATELLSREKITKSNFYGLGKDIEFH